MNPTRYHLFEAFGVELEYMIVRADTLSVLPITDQVIHDVVGEYTSEVERGSIAWSNELALHVLELKTNGPSQSLVPLAGLFQEQVNEINALLASRGACLMPTAMHPWMDPHAELKLWPHEYNPVYEALHRIFDCRGHGWANLQSVHLNLPFADDEEFGRLHAAIRLLLPLLPSLAASSPFAEGNAIGFLDTRMEHYRTNAAKIPQVSGLVVPEPVFTRTEYEKEIFTPLYEAISSYDPEKILQYEWLNARGAIARFDRNTIEIRVLDVQECPQADLAICALIQAVLQSLIEQRWTNLAEQQSWNTETLAEIFRQTIRDAERVVISDGNYLRQFGYPGSKASAQELWQHLRRSVFVEKEKGWNEALEVILSEGPLARRILKALGANPSHGRLQTVYRELCACLAEGRMFQNGVVAKLRK